MKRVQDTPRPAYQEQIEALGFDFHDAYWTEEAAYVLTTSEVEELEKATRACYEMYCEAVEYIISNRNFAELLVPEEMEEAICASWEEDELSLYGRFDFAIPSDGGTPKLLEFNADTPTSLLEAAIIQWQWLQDIHPGKDQYNLIHENLVQSWRDIHAAYGCRRYHFAGDYSVAEDVSTLRYLLSTAQEAGLPTAEMSIRDIDFDASPARNILLDPASETIECLFKLYPWEWMFEESPEACRSDCFFLEPLWKSLMSNKAMLPVLYRLFPDSPYLLPAYRFPTRLGGNYCQKPVFSREGENVTLVRNGRVLESTPSIYGEGDFIYQALVDIRSFEGYYPVIGSWVIGGEASGIGIRETRSRITDNMSVFVPHYFV